MRLPFGLGRRSSSGDEASGSGSGAGPGGPPTRPAAAPSRAWASLPPIQRTAGAMPLVAAPATFAGALPGSQALPPIVQPLGHEVSSLATPGLVVARVRPLEAHASGSIPAPVQRRTARGGSRTAPAAAAVAEVEVVEPVMHEAVPAVAPAPVAPIRTMPAVSRLAVRTPDRSLTNAAEAARPVAVQRAAAAAAATVAGSTTTLPPAVTGGMRRVPSAVAALPTVSREATSTSASPPSAQPVGALPSRRGVGEPMTSLPASARPVSSGAPVVSRSTTTGQMPMASSALRAPVQRSAATAAGPAGSARQPSLAQGPTGSGPTASAAYLAALPQLPVARPATAATPTVARVAQPASAPAVPEIRPIAGANPIRPAIALQRSASDDADDEPDDDGMPSPWWAPASDTPAARDGLGASAAMTGAAPVALQRSSSAEAFGAGAARPLGRRDGAPAFRATPVSAPVQRTAAQWQLSLASGRTATTEAVQRAVERISSASDGAAHASYGTTGGGSLTSAPVVQTSAAALPAGASGPAPAGFGARVAVQRVESPVAPAPAPQPAPARSDTDLEELAQALFGRIRNRLANELIHDREAKGLTFDNV